MPSMPSYSSSPSSRPAVSAEDVSEGPDKQPAEGLDSDG